MSKKRPGGGGNGGVANKRQQSPKFRLIPKMKYLTKRLPELTQEFIHSWNLVKLIIAIEVVINIIVIKNVKYTEIDWSTYMAQVSKIFNFTNLNFNFDYNQIDGPTGPLVYPAGHTYIFYFFKELTENGTNIRFAQYIYLCIYIAQLYLVFKIYSHKRVLKVPPYMFLVMCFTSYRIHSIYVLRLFNDPVAVLIAYASFYSFLRKRHAMSAFLFSVAISVKMNILLYAPAFALIFYEEVGLVASMKNACITALTQLVLAAPYLMANPMGYVQRAFDLSRVFLHKWTVNWRFLDEQTFSSPTFFQTMLALHMGLLFLVFWSRWLNVVLPKRFRLSARQDDPILTLFIANFIGVACSRSLHYQFYVWYYHSLPMLVWATRFSVPFKILILGCIEYCWNEYPSTSFSSLLLHGSHLIILAGLLLRNMKLQWGTGGANGKQQQAKAKPKKR